MHHLSPCGAAFGSVVALAQYRRAAQKSRVRHELGMIHAEVEGRHELPRGQQRHARDSGRQEVDVQHLVVFRRLVLLAHCKTRPIARLNTVTNYTYNHLESPSY